MELQKVLDGLLGGGRGWAARWRRGRVMPPKKKKAVALEDSVEEDSQEKKSDHGLLINKMHAWILFNPITHSSCRSPGRGAAALQL